MIDSEQTLLYVDIGLKVGGGHHLVHASAVEAMMNEIGWSVQFLGSKGGANGAAVPLKSFEAVFDVPMWISYDLGGQARIPGRFDSHTQMLAKAFEALLEWPSQNKIFVASAVFPIVRALEIFLSRYPSFHRGKKFFLELNHSPELGKPRGFYGHASTWYGHSIEAMRRQGIDLGLLATDPWLAKDYGLILGDGVREVALIRKIPQLRLEGRKKVVAFLGAQDRHKGYHMVPEIVGRFLDEHPDWAAFIHQSAQNEHPYWTRIDADILKMRNEGKKIQFVRGPLSEHDYQSILDQIGLLCLPYDPVFYSRAPSGVAQEAVMNAIPLVGPSGGTISELIESNNAPAYLFNSWTVEAITMAIDKALKYSQAETVQRINAAKNLHAKIQERSLAKTL